ncbi:aminopeptidase [Megasphaera sueciensis]|uniref:aminopeptidase n=1 Tax=Megasphaera sueciensis TaxID=349094 RepID=UPI003CFBFC30
MIEKNKLHSYALTLLKKGVNLQKKQILVVSAPVESSKFVTILTEAAYNCGASQVIINWHCDDTTRLQYEYEALEKFNHVPNWRREFSLHYYHKGAAFISLISANPYLMSHVDQEKIFSWQKAQNAALKEYIDGMMASKVSWLVAAVPSTTWAKILYPEMDENSAYERLWKQILSSSRADGIDPLHDWDKHLASLEKRRNWLSDMHFNSLHYTNNRGTDLTVVLPKQHIWQGGTEETTSHIPFNANIPTEEVYTAPLSTGTSGIVYNTKPLVYNGNVIDNFNLTFCDGRIIHLQADKGESILKQLIEVDDGASRLGEVALIPYHSPISLSNVLFYETLFDENASCHLALGKAYPTCLVNGSELNENERKSAGINNSMIHIDFMIGSEDLTIIGKKEDGTEIPVFINGDFAI